MIILRFQELLDFLNNEYKIKVSQKEFAEVAKLSPDRLSRIKLKTQKLHAEKKVVKKSLITKRSKRPNGEGERIENVNTDFLNQILEGACTLILRSRRRVQDGGEEDLFRKLVSVLVDYVPDQDSQLYEKTLASKDKTIKFINGYRDSTYNPELFRSASDYRKALRTKLVTEYNQKISPR